MSDEENSNEGSNNEEENEEGEENEDDEEKEEDEDNEGEEKEDDEEKEEDEDNEGEEKEEEEDEEDNKKKKNKKKEKNDKKKGKDKGKGKGKEKKDENEDNKDKKQESSPDKEIKNEINPKFETTNTSNNIMFNGNDITVGNIIPKKSPLQLLMEISTDMESLSSHIDKTMPIKPLPPIINDFNNYDYNKNNYMNNVNLSFANLDKDDLEIKQLIEKANHLSNISRLNNIKKPEIKTYEDKCCQSDEDIDNEYHNQDEEKEISENYINNYNNINERLIIELARRIKTLNIITDKIDNFKRIEKYLYREFGIILNISNNKKASLLKANIILNLDFTNEIINEYKIYNNAIIINILGNVIIKSKKFSGININYFNINIPDKYRINGFKNEEIYESIIYNLSYEKALEKLKQDNVKIKNLVGNRGIINKQEFLK